METPTQATTVDIKKIIELPELQARAKIDEAVVQDYADAFLAGKDMPCIQLVELTDTENSGKFTVTDGFQRLAALKSLKGKNKVKEILAEVYKGTLAEAMDLASSANQSHGLRRTNADKRRAIIMAFDADRRQNRTRSDREIAEHVGVHNSTVSELRAELGGVRKKRDKKASVSDSGETAATSVQVPDAPSTIDRDQLGIVIEDTAVLCIFQNSVEFDAITGGISKIKSMVTALAATPAGAELKAKSLDFDLTGAFDAVKFARPHTVCPYGPKCEKTCQSCHGKGWVTRAVYERLDQAIRTHHESKIPADDPTTPAVSVPPVPDGA